VRPAETALLAALRGGRVWVPADASAELVAQLEEQGCEVVRSCWVGAVTWEQTES
jgi:nicotinamidase-related amidase